MTIYADILVIVNLYIDFFLLWCVQKFLGLRTGGYRLAAGALAGGICSLSALLPISQAWASLLLGVLTAFAVTAAAFLPMGSRLYFRAVLCFWAFTLLLAGFFLFVLRFFSPKNVAVLGSVVYFDLSPALLFLFTCGAYAVFSLLNRLLPKTAQDGGYCWITVENLGKTVRIYAKADTGNALREPFSGLPVLVCQADSVKDVAPPAVLEFLKAGNPQPDPSLSGGLRLIPFEALGGQGILPAFRPEKVAEEKSGEAPGCYIAVCREKLSAGQFDALYHPDLFRK